MADRPVRGREVRPLAAVGDDAGRPLPDRLQHRAGALHARTPASRRSPASCARGPARASGPGPTRSSTSCRTAGRAGRARPRAPSSSCGPGRAATGADARAVHLIGVGAYLACVLILLLGGRRIERTLEILNWMLVLGILGTLAVLCVAFAEPSRFAAAGGGLRGLRHRRAASFRLMPAGADWFLIGAFAAYSGCGGVTNITLSNWARDKGYGMGQVVGLHPHAGRRAARAAGAHRQRVRAGRGSARALARLVAHRARGPVGHLLPGRAAGHGAAGHPLHRDHPARHRDARAGHRVRAGPRPGRARRPGHGRAARPGQRVDPVQDAARHPGGARSAR